MLANLGREVVGSPGVQILECKTAGINGARLWKHGVPEYIQLQVMHQLAVTGKQAADVAVLICGQELQVHRIEQFIEAVDSYIRWYNEKRIKISLGTLSPIKYRVSLGLAT